MIDRRTLQDYAPIVGNDVLRQLRLLAADLKGLRVVHVNSTRLGGGVAEILDWMVSLMCDLELDASWEVVEGNPEFFAATKTFHNGLQGHSVRLTPAMIQCYEDTVRMNAERLRPVLEAADFVFIHDPQPAALIDHCPNRKGRWIWRCHVNASHPNRKVWTYLASKVIRYDASIFSMADFAQPLPHPQFIIPPSIDPLSDKNRELAKDEIDAALEGLHIPREEPILIQISRFDRFKDPLGVIQAFDLLRQTIPARLILAGGGAADDPEGAEVFEEVQNASRNDPLIHIHLLPGDANVTVNALQRASSVVVQKSVQEGFGLTVTEALWKSKPVIGGNTGGIRLQVHNHQTGFLVDSPEGAALWLRYLLERPAEIQRMGATGKDLVRDNFLLTRQLRDVLTLIQGLRRGLNDALLAG